MCSDESLHPLSQSPIFPFPPHDYVEIGHMMKTYLPHHNECLTGDAEGPLWNHRRDVLSLYNKSYGMCRPTENKLPAPASGFITSFNSDVLLVFKDILFSIVWKNCSFLDYNSLITFYFNGLNINIFTVAPNYLKKIRHESIQIYPEWLIPQKFLPKVMTISTWWWCSFPFLFPRVQHTGISDCKLRSGLSQSLIKRGLLKVT